MKGFMYALVIALTVLVTSGFVYGLSRLSCEGCGDETTEEETAETLSVKFLSDDPTEDPEEDETVEAKQWVRITFDVVVIALSVGIIVLVWWLIKKVTKKYGKSNRRFG